MKIIKLSESFYEEYSGCSEIMRKHDRPYYCLELKVDSITYAIPFRHHIQHQYSFLTINNAGLDYSKAVVLASKEMISDAPVRIDTAEWRLINGHEDDILFGFVKYLRLYRKALKNRNIPKYQRIIEYSALKYFDIG